FLRLRRSLAARGEGSSAAAHGVRARVSAGCPVRPPDDPFARAPPCARRTGRGGGGRRWRGRWRGGGARARPRVGAAPGGGKTAGRQVRRGWDGKQRNRTWSRAEPMNESDSNEFSIAVTGMSGRFPGAADLAAFWSNLRAGVESIRPFTSAELAGSASAADLA